MTDMVPLLPGQWSRQLVPAGTCRVVGPVILPHPDQSPPMVPCDGLPQTACIGRPGPSHHARRHQTPGALKGEPQWFVTSSMPPCRWQRHPVQRFPQHTPSSLWDHSPSRPLAARNMPLATSLSVLTRARSVASALRTSRVTRSWTTVSPWSRGVRRSGSTIRPVSSLPSAVRTNQTGMFVSNAVRTRMALR